MDIAPFSTSASTALLTTLSRCPDAQSTTVMSLSGSARAAMMPILLWDLTKALTANACPCISNASFIAYFIFCFSIYLF
jgi:hypothetical protein